jgi:transposase-like protein
MCYHANVMHDLIHAETFWERCAAAGIKDCWPWTGPTGWGGYGIVQLRDGRSERAHRVAYVLTVQQPLAAGECVLQRCGNRLCVNPHHLYKSRRKLQGRRGAGNGRAKLTEQIVSAIRSQRMAGSSCAALAAKYGVSPSTISRVVHGRTWNNRI